VVCPDARRCNTTRSSPVTSTIGAFHMSASYTRVTTAVVH